MSFVSASDLIAVYVMAAGDIISPIVINEGYPPVPSERQLP